MNKVILMGRLTRDPEVRYSQGERSMAIAKYTLAIDRRKTQQNSDPGADFINCVAFDRAGEFAEKYFRQGLRVLISGHRRPGTIQIRMVRRSIQQMLSLKVRSLRIADGTAAGLEAGDPKMTTS